MSSIDDACKIHDMLYNSARSVEDIRAADNRLIADIRKDASAGPKQKAVLIAGIKAKTLGEDLKIFGPETFTQIPGLQQGKGPLSFYPTQRHKTRNLLLSSSRDVRSIMGNSLSRTKLPALTRFGSNGVVSPSIVSPDNLARLARRLAKSKGVVMGNVTNGDPTISGMQASNKIAAISGKGHRGFTRLSPMAATDHTFKKSVDPTIGNFATQQPANFTGQGSPQRRAPGPFKSLEPRGDGLILPGRALRTRVLRDRSKQKKRLARLALVSPVQQGFRRRAGLRGFGKGQKRGQKGGIFGFLASLAASFVVPAIVKAFRKKKKGKGKHGRGISLAGSGPGKKLIQSVARRHGIDIKKLGLSIKEIQSLFRGALGKIDLNKILKGKGLTGPALPGQEGGQFGFLASLLAPLAVKAIIKAVKGKKRRR